MFLYNSLNRKVEEFVPHNDKEVTLYTCGPTVYHYAHIGNLRSYIVEDVLEKALRYVGYNVKRAMNITDVGHLSGDFDDGKDKMVEEAKKENKGVLEIAKFYTEAFKKDCDMLNIEWPEIVVPATSCIDLYIEMIKKLLDNEYAYISNGNVYFDVSKLENYYTLTNQSGDEMLVGAREDVTNDEGKRNPQDFALWFTKSKFENQALKWDSPWGEGYPGWHIECSGISYKYLGEYLDIHCGGVDNKFPHHTNEIAQSESYLGHKWCNYWFHVEHLIMKDGKMSKSLGNVVTVNSLKEAGYAPEVYRFFCLQSHYRNKLLFSYEGLEGAKSAYNKLISRIDAIKNAKVNGEELQSDEVAKFDDKFKEALNNDLNTSMAITTLLDVLKSDMNVSSKLILVQKFDEVLGLSLMTYNVNQEESAIDDDLRKVVEEKIEERKAQKKAKNYAEADRIRAELLEKYSIELIDTAEGTKYRLKA